MESVVPNYDRERVYMSDIKKLSGWYNIVSKFVPFTEAENTTTAEAEAPGAETEPVAAEPEIKAKKAKKSSE